jgi:hypothetical protein
MVNSNSNQLPPPVAGRRVLALNKQRYGGKNHTHKRKKPKESIGFSLFRGPAIFVDRFWRLRWGRLCLHGRRLSAMLVVSIGLSKGLSDDLSGDLLETGTAV